MRSLGSTIIGEAVYTVIGISIMFLGKLDTLSLLAVMMSSMGLKIIYNLATIIPTSITVAFLKQKEESDPRLPFQNLQLIKKGI